MGFHKSQVFFYLLSSFIFGVFCASFLSIPTSFILGALIICLVLVAILGYQNKLIFFSFFVAFAFILGIFRFNYFENLSGDLNNQIDQEVILAGYIANEPEIDGNLMRFVFKVGQERILVTTNRFPEREFGDSLSIKGKLELPRNFSSKDGQAEFDYVAYLKKDGIRLTIFYPKEIKTTNLALNWSENLKISVYKNIFVIKNKFENTINILIPEPNASFINGIILGTRQNIPDSLRDAFKNTGTTHILAISGYNIMIISEAILLGLIRFFRRRIAFWISFVSIVLFVILTGASASVVRAAVMGLILTFANSYGRLYDQKNSIILAGGLMIWFNPLVLVFDIGFQLSFASLLGLIYIYSWLNRKLNKIPKLGGLKELLVMTFSAQLAVTPLLIYYFGNFSIISLPANILILPLVPYAMLAGFLTGIIGILFPFIGQLFGYIAWAITTYQISIIEFFALI